MKLNRKNDIRSLTLLSVFSSIILLMSLVPQIGFITIMPGVSLTLVHIPVLIGIFLLPKNYSWILGFMHGLGSMIAAYLYGATPFDLAFQYPWIAFIPRILYVVVAAYIYDGFKWLFTHAKQAKTIVFGVVVFISIFAIFFGIKAVVHNFAFADYTTTVSERAVLQAEIDSGELTPAEIADHLIDIATIDLQMDDIYDQALADESRINQVTIPVSLVIAGLFMTVYFAFIINGKEDETIYPSTIILATLTHTVFVLLTVALFQPEAFTKTFGENAGVIQIIYAIAGANGLIEALAAVMIGTPIIIGLKQVSSKN